MLDHPVTQVARPLIKRGRLLVHRVKQPCAAVVDGRDQPVQVGEPPAALDPIVKQIVEQRRALQEVRQLAPRDQDLLALADANKGKQLAQRPLGAFRHPVTPRVPDELKDPLAAERLHRLGVLTEHRTDHKLEFLWQVPGLRMLRKRIQQLGVVLQLVAHKAPPSDHRVIGAWRRVDPRVQ
jgi:hypothetical protein